MNHFSKASSWSLTREPSSLCWWFSSGRPIVLKVFLLYGSSKKENRSLRPFLLLLRMRSPKVPMKPMNTNADQLRTIHTHEANTVPTSCATFLHFSKLFSAKQESPWHHNTDVRCGESVFPQTFQCFPNLRMPWLSRVNDRNSKDKMV